MTTTTDDYLVHRLTDDTYADIAYVQDKGGIAWVEVPSGVRAVMITDHATIKQIGVRKDVSRDGAQHWAALRSGDVPLNTPEVPWAVGASFFSAFGEEHRRLRKLAAPAFTKRRTDLLEPAIRQAVTNSLDEMERKRVRPRQWMRPWGTPEQVMDLREVFCFPVPIATISALLGVDDDLFPTIKSGADALFDSSLSAEELGGQFMALVGAITELIKRKTATPDDSLISSLIQAHEGDDRYTPEEIAETVRIVIVAGYETTVNLLDQCVYQLLTHREYLAMVLAGHITWDDVIDEALRHSSPAVTTPFRFPTKDVEILGMHVPMGTPVLLSFAGAGRDPKVHDNPDVFDPTRAKKDHVGFGTGVHRCPGAPLAVLEAQVALPMLFERFYLELVEDPAKIAPNRGFITNGHDELLVRIKPRD